MYFYNLFRENLSKNFYLIILILNAAFGFLIIRNLNDSLNIDQLNVFYFTFLIMPFSTSIGFIFYNRFNFYKSILNRKDFIFLNILNSFFICVSYFLLNYSNYTFFYFIYFIIYLNYSVVYYSYVFELYEKEKHDILIDFFSNTFLFIILYITNLKFTIFHYFIILLLFLLFKQFYFLYRINFIRSNNFFHFIDKRFFELLYNNFFGFLPSNLDRIIIYFLPINKEFFSIYSYLYYIISRPVQVFYSSLFKNYQNKYFKYSISECHTFFKRNFLNLIIYFVLAISLFSYTGDINFNNTNLSTIMICCLFISFGILMVPYEYLLSRLKDNYAIYLTQLSFVIILLSSFIFKNNIYIMLIYIIVMRYITFFLIINLNNVKKYFF